MKIAKISVAFALLLFPLLAGAGPMKAGKWQITITTEIAGVEGGMPPTTMSECVTADEAANPQPPAGGVGNDCKISDYKISGNVISWSVSCPKEDVTGSGSMTFAGDAYTGAAK